MRLIKAASEMAVLLLACMASLRAQTNVLTFHNDNARTGQNVNEVLLTPSSVASGQFHKLYSVPVDGVVFAQPLVLTKVNVPNQGTHNVVYVVTENDSLYGIDADDGTVLWQTSFINPSAGVTTIPTSAIPSSPACVDVGPTIGITGTPAIDASTGTIYLVASTQENSGYVQRLHAINVATGAEKFGGPVIVQAEVPGTGNGSQNGIISFDPLLENQRPGLLLQDGQIVIGWGSHCDFKPYEGWIMAYNATTLTQEAVISTTPNGDKGGIWLGGTGLAADSNYNLFVAVGDGDYDGVSNWGDTVLKLNGSTGASLGLLDWFTPYNQAFMNTNNKDLGSGGVLLLPDLPAGSSHQQLLISEGKLGAIYLIDRNNMGQYCSTCTTTDIQIVQELTGVTSGIWGMPAYWNGNVYFGGRADAVKALSFNANNSGLLSSTPTSQTSATFGFPGITPSVSANGTTNGIVWVLDNESWGASCCQGLLAYDATNLSNLLYNSSLAPNNSDVPGVAVKFSVPTIANGKVYVGSKANISIYGLPVAAAAPTFSPAGGRIALPKR